MANDFPKPPFPDQRQPMPGSSAAMDPPPDYGEDSYKGSGRLADKKAIITGARQRDRTRGRPGLRPRRCGRSGQLLQRGRGCARDPASCGSRGTKSDPDAGRPEGPVALPGHRRSCSPGVRPRRHLGQQRRPSGELQVDRRDQRRRVGCHVPDQHPRDVLSHQGSGAAHARGQRHHQHDLGQRGYSVSAQTRISHNVRRENCGELSLNVSLLHGHLSDREIRRLS